MTEQTDDDDLADLDLDDDDDEELDPALVARLTAILGFDPTVARSDADRDDEGEGEGLALDRASLRSYDADGRLRVANCNISKANICPYLGSEIPDWQALGLDPERTYRLYRDPDELAKAAPSFCGVPLLSRHVPVSAADHRPGDVVGSIGTDAEFDPPYLKASLIIWADHAIRDVRAELKRELSSGYRYRADMTPGAVDGKGFDGVMREIVGNHVALVGEGRAGPDVVVGDAATNRSNPIMAGTKVSRTALMAAGALTAYLRPKLAQDQKLELGPMLVGIDGKNWTAKRAGLAAAVRAAAKGKMAQDADMGDLTDLLEALGSGDPDDIAEIPASAGVSGIEKVEGDAPGGDGPAEKLIAFLSDKLSPEDLEQAQALVMAASAPAAPAGAAGTDADPVVDPDAKEKDKPDMDTPPTKPVMDAAIAAAVRDAETRAAKTRREIFAAEQAIRPYVGQLAMAHDSAESVFRAALGILNVKNDGIHPSALEAVLKAQPLPGRQQPRTHAMDAAGAKGFADRYPSASRIQLG